MNRHDQDAEALVASALNSGSVILPQQLLDAVGQLSSPLNFLIATEPEAGPFDVLREEYPALHLRRSGSRSLNSAEAEQAVGLLRWVLREVLAWTRECDPGLVKLTAVIVVLNEFDWSDAHWALLSDTAVNPELIKLLCDIVKSYRCEIYSEPGHGATTTNDLMASLVKADSEGDWVAISASWQQIETWLHGGFFLRLAVSCLARFDMSGLAAAMNEVLQIQMAYSVASSLSEANRVKLARATLSRRYRFAAVLSIAWGKRVFTEIGDEAENELSALLAEVSQDTDQWPRWMRAFNEYPTRFPAMQRPLGRALAQAPEHALASYVDSISLYAWPLNGPRYGQPSRPDGRQSVGLCLATFREAANSEQRCKLWHLAHTRWQWWGFGLQSSSERHLIGIASSELDFAITAHAVECLTTDQRKAQLELLLNEVRDVEKSWHQSVSDLRSSRNASLSKMQPLLAADSANWLFALSVIPPEVIQNPYARRKFE